MKTYPFYTPQDGVILPWIPVRLGFKKTHKILPASIPALLDTGADVCFLSEEIAAFLGYSEKGKKSREFTAANNEKFPAYPEKFTLYGIGKEFECEFFVSKTLPKGLRIILGINGFFDKHNVCFDVRDNEIKIIGNDEN